jgi:coenzyme PQQ precursor peptide PqqA
LPGHEAGAAPAWVLQKSPRPSRHLARAFIATPKETLMQWSQPAFEDMRFGFEITMYISNR